MAFNIRIPFIKSPWLSLLGSLALVLLLILLNRTFIALRLVELDNSLETLSKMQDVNRSMEILAKFDIIQNRLTRSDESNTDYFIESQVMAVTSGDMFTEKKRKKTALEPLAEIIFKTLRLFIGKKTNYEIIEEYKNQNIQIAYVYERNKRFAPAVSYYLNALKELNETTGNLYAYIQLHLGYCYALQGNFKQANQVLQLIIKNYPGSEHYFVASKMIETVENLSKKLNLSQQNKSASPLEKARQLFFLMDFNGAIRIYENFLKTNPDSKQAAEAKFYIGRSYEELGDYQLALNSYQIIKNKYATGKWSEEAKKRTYIISKFYKLDDKSAELELHQIRDNSFIEQIDRISKLNKKSRLDSLVQTLIMDTVKSNQDKDKSLANFYAGLDLEGKSLPSETEGINPTQQQPVMGHAGKNPKRHPALLKKIFDKNAVELKYLYNKFLKSDQNLQGRILVDLEILANGTVGEIALSYSSMNNPAFEQQVREKIKSWSFERIDSQEGSMVVRSYPFEFHPE